MTHSRARILELLGDELAPRRDLGQNFVADPNTVRRIAALAGVGPGDRVVEIGAGLGSLTLALAETGAEITAIEIDRGIVPVLRGVAAPHPNVRVLEADAMTLDWHALLSGVATRPPGAGGGGGLDTPPSGRHSTTGNEPTTTRHSTTGNEPNTTRHSTTGSEPATGGGWTLVANLPYNIATPLVADLLDTVPEITTMLVMVQKEVAQRFAAGPGSKQYGAVSVKVAYWGTARLVATVPPTVFVPRPNVDSAVVRIDRGPPPEGFTETDRARLFTLVRTAFGQRRKMLRRSLAADVTATQFGAAGVSPEARPEDLSLAQWVALTTATGAH